MLKPIPRSNVVVRPFTTFKNWTLQNQNYDSFLTTEDDCPLFIDYTIDVNMPCSASICYSSSSLALEAQTVNSQISIQDGEYIQGIFYPNRDPINRDGSYKRLVFNTIKTMFYNNFDNPLELFGIQDYDSGLEKRAIWDSVIAGNISNQIYGERIQSGSVTIIDNSSVDQQVILHDDGYTNLIVTNNTLVTEQVIGAPPIEASSSAYYDPAHDRVGSSVSAWNGYVIAGAPMDAESFSEPKAGSAFLYKYDSSQNKYRSIKRFYSPFSQEGYATEVGFDDNNLLMTEIGNFLNLDGPDGWAVNDSFGEAVSINDGTLAIGAPTCDLCGSTSGSGQVYVYGKYKGGSDHWGILNVLEGSCSLDQFGASVSVSGDLLAVGAPGANSGTGLVYVFRKQTYGVTIPTSSFWYVVKSENDWCTTLTGETDDTSSITSIYTAGDFTSSLCNGPTTSSVFDYPSDNPTPITNVETDNTTYYDIAGETVTPAFITGNAVWGLEAILSTSSSLNDNFGYSLSLSGSFLAIGCETNSPSSSVYIFESQSIGWVRTAYLNKLGLQDTTNCMVCTSSIEEVNAFDLYDPNTLSTSNPSAYFGRSVALNNDVLLVGVPYDLSFIPYSGSTNTYNVGSVYVYTRYTKPDIEVVDYDCGLPITGSVPNCGWRLVNKLYESSSIQYVSNYYGYSVDMDDTRFVIGSLYGDITLSASYDTGSNTTSIQDYTAASTGPFASDSNTLQGRAFVYSIAESASVPSFTLEKVISKQKAANTVKAAYGYSVAVDSNHVLVGAPVFTYGMPSASFSSLRDLMPSNVSGSTYAYNMNELTTTQSAGNIFYKNGLITITNTGSVFQNTFGGTGGTGYAITFQGTHTIYEHEVLCQISPGEFNVSTNPTSVINGTIPYDVNNDGIFDATDFNYLMQYYYNAFIQEDIAGQKDDDGVEAEITPPAMWWGDELILTESEDVLLIEPDVETIYSSSLQTLESQPFYQHLLTLDAAGDLDINGDGATTVEDARILFNYYYGKRDFSLVSGNVTPTSTRTNASQILAFLDFMTGKQNGRFILSDFQNYVESSSLDATGSYLAPFITSIGLYDGATLVAVAKLGQPIKNLISYPINFIVTYDQ